VENEMVKIYEYSNCSTCKQALKFLDAKRIKYDRLPIVETPPSPSELKQMLTYLRQNGRDLKNLFNTSGVQYRELGLAEKLKAGMTDSDALKLLSQNGKLVKRPFLLLSGGGTVGFKVDEWTKLLK
jgi:arsenate reductase (glutaredoxin)